MTKTRARRYREYASGYKTGHKTGTYVRNA